MKVHALSPRARFVQPLRSGGRALEESVRRRFEPRFGVDFSQVRIHANDEAAASARAFGARAYTAGSHVVFGNGEYAPHTATGERLLAHELTHVAQQKRGATQAITDVDSAAEREANVLASSPAFALRPQAQVNAAVARQHASFGEKVAAVVGVGPIDATTAWNISTEALAAANASGLPGVGSDGPGDAYRHCFWNCRMTAEIGADQAQTIATSHETHGEGSTLSHAMDFFNNRVGRSCSGDCDQCARSKLAAGELLVFENGKLVPSGGVKPQPLQLPSAKEALKPIGLDAIRPVPQDNTIVIPRGGPR
ncbi:MAG: hypothetical protein QOI24_1389 [Acidobacteriota bacterium]|jgi:hypothetical protein|nr:hypothetical protein [Acidobacteriota bacterium]